MVCQHLVGKFSSDIETWGQCLLAGLNGIDMLGKVNACQVSAYQLQVDHGCDVAQTPATACLRPHANGVLYYF